MTSLGDILRGIQAGLVATLVLSVVTISWDVLPQLDPVVLIRGVLGDLEVKSGVAAVPAIGWIWNVMVGTLWGGMLFSLMQPILPGRKGATKGACFGLGCALLVMVMVIPMAGAGYYGMELHALAPLVTLGVYLVYGIVLGATYGALVGERA
jgi:hypothetical protein